jgi:hypothetical protein
MAPFLCRYAANLDPIQRSELLYWIAAIKRLPPGGFAPDWRMTIKLVSGGLTHHEQLAGVEPKQLPCAHTCVNQLDLPLYQTRATFEAKLGQAVRECREFWLA